MGGQAHLSFYNSSDIQRNKSTFRVWTKGLDANATNRAMDTTTLDEKSLSVAAEKIASGYSSPLTRTGEVEANVAVLAEAIANLDTIEPSARVLIELDCARQQFRDLYEYFRIGDTIGTRDQPREWRHIPQKQAHTNL
jgi:hypothetical protein